MSDQDKMMQQQPKKRTFRSYIYRGHDLNSLLDMTPEQLSVLFRARQRRRITRGFKKKTTILLKKLRSAKKNCPYNEKPACIKTHLRNTIITPEMIGSIVGIHNGLNFFQVELKPEMLGHYLGEFAPTYKPVHHGKPGLGATHSSRFVPLK